MPRYQNDYEAAKAQGQLWTLGMAKGGALKVLLTAKTGITYSSGVSAWKDQSARSLSAVQATAVNQPGYLANGWGGNLPALQLVSDGTSTSDDMTVSGLTAGLCGGRPAIFALVKPSTNILSAGGCVFWRATGTRASGLSYNSVFRFGFTFNDNGDSYGFTGGPNITQERTLWGMWVPDINTGHVIVNGTFYTATSAGGFAALGSGPDAVIGQDPFSDARHYDGLIAAIAVFDGTQLTRSEIDKISAAMMWEWGIQDSLPASSPYRNSPPMIGA